MSHTLKTLLPSNKIQVQFRVKLSLPEFFYYFLPLEYVLFDFLLDLMVKNISLNGYMRNPDITDDWNSF